MILMFCQLKMPYDKWKLPMHQETQDAQTIYLSAQCVRSIENEFEMRNSNKRETVYIFASLHVRNVLWSVGVENTVGVSLSSVTYQFSRTISAWGGRVLAVHNRFHFMCESEPSNGFIHCTTKWIFVYFFFVVLFALIIALTAYINPRLNEHFMICKASDGQIIC